MRERRPRFAAAIALVFLPVLARGQQQSGSIAPFVSRLKAEVVEFQVSLSWKDTADVAGVNLVYRSTEEITEKTLATAVFLDRVAQGVERYIDTPPDQGNYYYAVLVEDSAKKVYSMLIPFRNKTSAPVAVQAAAPEEKLASRISEITASLSPAGDSIEVTFRSSNPSRELLLFWGSSPMTRPEDLLRETSKTQIDAGTTRFELAILPGADYYFAVLDAGMYKLGKAQLEAGSNSTTSPVRAYARAEDRGEKESAEGSAIASVSPLFERRALPLPSLDLLYGVQSGQRIAGTEAPDLPQERKLSPATTKAIALLLQAIPEQPPMEMKAQVLASDSTPLQSGELSILQGIVNGPFTAGDMSRAEKLISDFLSLPRSSQNEARARFYLGQAYYFQGRMREALFEFLQSEEQFPRESAPWKDACVRKLAR